MGVSPVKNLKAPPQESGGSTAVSPVKNLKNYYYNSAHCDLLANIA